VMKEERIYNARMQTLADLIREVEGAGVLLMVGHNPGLHDLANALIGSGDIDVRESLNEKLPTSGLVAIDFAFGDWSELRDSSGRLDRFVTPRSLDNGAD
jgi:phosphohistidine phosphatase